MPGVFMLPKDLGETDHLRMNTSTALVTNSHFGDETSEFKEIFTVFQAALPWVTRLPNVLFSDFKSLFFRGKYQDSQVAQ